MGLLVPLLILPAMTTLLPIIHCKTVHVVDLTYGYDEHTVGYPGGQPFTWTKKRTSQIGGIPYYANDFHVAEHWGTHIDAPKHFNNDAISLEKMPLGNFFATGVLVNVTSDTGTNASYLLPVEKLMEWETQNGEIPEKSVLFINFGWGKKYYHDRKLYLGESEDQLKFPSISAEAAQWIFNTKRVIGVAVDTPSPDPPYKGDAHVLFSKNEIYILENVNLTAPLPPTFKMVALPIKLIDGTGGPTRVVAMYPE